MASRLFRRLYTSAPPSTALPTPPTGLPTIYALSTPPGKSALAIIRVSGPLTQQIYSRLSPNHPLPQPRRASLRPILHPYSKQPLDPETLVLFFPGPKSQTGEDVLELHTHGSKAVVRSVLTALGSLGARPAEKGEFIQRGFVNGRVGMLEVEGLWRMLEAETEGELRAAVGFGEVKSVVEDWREKVVLARGRVEAVIDFAEDTQGVESEVELRAVREETEGLRIAIGGYLESSTRGELLRDGISLALMGPPNAGKSSLLNRIVGREAAIVSPVPGTTRDVVDLAVDIGGYKVLLGDTAGLRHSQDVIEAEGIKRARKRLEEADVGILVLSLREDGSVDLDMPSIATANEFLASSTKKSPKELLVVLNKSDLLEGRPPPISDVALHFPPSTPIVPTSTLSLSPLILLPYLISAFSRLTDPLSPMVKTSASLSLLARHRTHLQNAKEILQRCRDEEDMVILAEMLREVAEELGLVLGRYGEGGSKGVEEVLGNIFGRFCVGK